MHKPHSVWSAKAWTDSGKRNTGWVIENVVWESITISGGIYYTNTILSITVSSMTTKNKLLCGYNKNRCDSKMSISPLIHFLPSTGTTLFVPPWSMQPFQSTPDNPLALFPAKVGVTSVPSPPSPSYKELNTLSGWGTGTPAMWSPVH